MRHRERWSEKQCVDCGKLVMSCVPAKQTQCQKCGDAEDRADEIRKGLATSPDRKD